MVLLVFQAFGFSWDSGKNIGWEIFWVFSFFQLSLLSKFLFRRVSKLPSHDSGEVQCLPAQLGQPATSKIAAT